MEMNSWKKGHEQNFTILKNAKSAIFGETPAAAQR